MPETGSLRSGRPRQAFDGVVAGLRIAGAVGQEHAVGLVGQHVGQRRLGGHHGDFAAAVGHQAQDVGLPAEHVGHPAEAAGFRLGEALPPPPGAFGPVAALGGGHDLGQVMALHALEGAGQLQRALGVLAHHDAGAQGAFLAQDAGQFAGIDAGDGDHALRLQVVGQGLGGAEVGQAGRTVANHEPGSMGLGGFGVLRVGTGITDVRIGKRNNLPAVAWVGQDFLITRHGRIENDFSNAVPLGTD